MGTFPQDFPTDTIAAGGGGGGGSATRSGRQAIVNGAQIVTVVFSSAMPSTNYGEEFAFINAIDGAPIFLQGVVTARTINGFTVTLNAPADSGNYVMTFTAVEDV